MKQRNVALRGQEMTLNEAISNKTKCDNCGAELGFIKDVIKQNAKRACPSCGKIHYIDSTPIDFEKVGREK